MCVRDVIWRRLACCFKSKRRRLAERGTESEGMMQSMCVVCSASVVIVLARVSASNGGILLGLRVSKSEGLILRLIIVCSVWKRVCQ